MGGNATLSDSMWIMAEIISTIRGDKRIKKLYAFQNNEQKYALPARKQSFNWCGHVIKPSYKQQLFDPLTVVGPADLERKKKKHLQIKKKKKE